MKGKAMNMAGEHKRKWSACSIFNILLTLLLALAINICIWMHFYYKNQIFLWKSDVMGHATMHGTYNAKIDFDAGIKRIYILVPGTVERQDTRQMQGEFQVWSWPACNQETLDYGSSLFVQAYNNRMHRLADKQQQEEAKRSSLLETQK